MLRENTFKHLLPLIKRNFKKVLQILLISGIFSFYAWVIFVSTSVTLPSLNNPIIFYSNQTRQDIKLLFCQALKKANQSIFLSIYGLSDKKILTLLKQKIDENISVRVEYDKSASGSLKKILPSSLAIKTQGLMHRKIAVIDHTYVMLGSANLTTTSLRHHTNLVLALWAPHLAAFLENPTCTSFCFEIQNQQAEVFLLPDKEELGLTRILQQIGQAQKKIDIAMFTLTHPLIGDTLIEAKRRGVDVRIAIDYYTAKGASKKVLDALQKEGIRLFLSQGRELLHHKWAIIDDTTLVMGSANWTKAAFTKNHDFLFFLSPLSQKQSAFLSNLWEIIEAESN